MDLDQAVHNAQMRVRYAISYSFERHQRALFYSFTAAHIAAKNRHLAMRRALGRPVLHPSFKELA